MPLPLLPGLMKNADDQGDDLPTEQPEGLTQFLDGLEEDDILGLVSAADDYNTANPDATVDPDADPEDPAEATEGEDDGTEEDPDALGDTDPAPPPDGEEAPAEGDEGDGTGSIDAIDAQMDEDIANAASTLSQMQDLADGDSESAPDVAKLVKQATGLSDKIDKRRKLLDKAMKAEDPQAAAQAGMDAQDSLTAMEHLLEAAKALGVKTEAPGMTDKDHPAIKAWSAKVQGKKLDLPSAAAKPAVAAPKPAFAK